MRFNVVNVTQPAVLRTGGAVGTKHHQTDMGLLWTPPAMNIRFEGNAAFTNQREGATIRAFELQNRAAGPASCGVGFRLSNRIWKAGRLSADGATYTDFTSSVQSATGTATLGVDAANQTGFAIGCLIPFDWFSVNITTAETDAGGAVPDHAVQYSNAAGTGWTAIGANAALTDDFTADNAVLDAAVHNFVWAKPTDWGVATALGGVTAGYYWLRVTTADKEAADIAAVCTGIEIGVGKFREAIADNGIYAGDTEQISCAYATGMVGYFSVANAGNMISALVETGG